MIFPPRLSRFALFIVGALLLLTLAQVSAVRQTEARGALLEIMIPLYLYPEWWDPASYAWDEVAAANQQAPVTAIINPNNGPDGGPPNEDYQYGLQELQAAGVGMIGYVYTLYGERPLAEVKQDVDLYNVHFSAYGVTGIFVDEVPPRGHANSGPKLAYYQELYAYIHSRSDLEWVVLNPGAPIAKRYLDEGAGDTAVIFEDHSALWPPYQPDPWVRNYPAERFALLIHEVPDIETARSHIDLAVARNIRYLYLTNDGADGNPWDELPSFWEEEVAYVAQLNAGPTPTPTRTRTRTATTTATRPVPTRTRTATAPATATRPAPTRTRTATQPRRDPPRLVPAPRPRPRRDPPRLALVLRQRPLLCRDPRQRYLEKSPSICPCYFNDDLLRPENWNRKGWKIRG